MAENRESNSLIGYLQDLYGRLVQAIFEIRSRDFSGSKPADAGQGIQNLLSERMEKLAAASEKPAGGGDRESGRGPVERPLSVGPRPVRRSGEGGDAAPDFTQHFHDRGADELVGSSVGDKIKARAVEHINKALLLARQGDMTNARMHAGIADSAVKEAARFMDGKEYGEFVELVKERLKKFEA
jgi:hypothetical protein